MNKANTSVAEMHIDDDGILQIRFFKGVTITLDEIKEYYKVSNELLAGKKALVLVDASEDYNVTDEAKAFGQTDEATKNRIAIAYVTSSITNRIMFNLYVKIYKPTPYYLENAMEVQGGTFVRLFLLTRPEVGCWGVPEGVVFGVIFGVSAPWKMDPETTHPGACPCTHPSGTKVRTAMDVPEVPAVP